MRVAVFVMVAMGCAPASTRWGVAIPVEPGRYTFAREARDPHGLSRRGIDLVLGPVGDVRATARAEDIFVPQHDGELERFDREDLELAGSWATNGREAKVSLEAHSRCAAGFGEAPCAHRTLVREPRWRLRCGAWRSSEARAMSGRIALVCSFEHGDTPRLASVVDGMRVLVLYLASRA